VAANAQRLDTIDRASLPTIDVAKPNRDIPIEIALRKIVASTGKSYFDIIREIFSLGFGPGRISFRDYVRLRLFDDHFYDNLGKKSVIGQKRNRDISVGVNYRIDWYAVLENKISSISYLATYGLPIIPLEMIYGENLKFKTPLIARNSHELREFLADTSRYPLFGKPAEAFQSLGTIALRRYLAAGDKLERTDRTTIAVDEFLKDISSHYATGYLFQKLIRPHSIIHNFCGDRLATARIVTVATETGPKIFRACMKIPAGANSADNYWRPGNLLAQVDITDGRILRVISGTGLDLVQVTRHPDTGRQLVGEHIPIWHEMIDVALAGAKLMQHLPLIGWDIAAAESGAVIVEMNETPDLFLHQLADGRGVLEPEFTAFMDYQEHQAREYERRIRTSVNKL
jgi:hypothetical protein